MTARKTAGILFVVFFAATLIMVFATSPRVERLPASVAIADDGKLGFAADPGIANFGSVPRGNIGEREIVLKNYDDFPKTIRLAANGKIKDWIYFPENNFVLEKNEMRKVAVGVIVPNDAASGKHDGTIIALIKRKWL